MSREGVLNVESAFVPGHLKWDAALWFNYANDSMALYEGDERVVSLLMDATTLTWWLPSLSSMCCKSVSIFL
ncbi:MAG: hypothetical protein R3C68_17825 [Myxococcota bacterium]